MYGGNRDGWEFSFPASELRAAADTKRLYHKEHWQHWAQRYDIIIVDIKEHGLEVRKNHQVTGGPTADVVVDVSYQKQLNEAVAKRKEHLDLMHEYGRWVTVFELNPSHTLNLVASDIAYFDLGEKPEPKP